jgi:hypothetical protein
VPKKLQVVAEFNKEYVPPSPKEGASMNDSEKKNEQ